MMTDAPGRRLASGRDCDILAVGRDRVLRRARDGRSLEREAAVMRHVAAHGYPVPEVFDANGPEIVMARVDGPNLFDDAWRHPDRFAGHARLLAGLHHRLGQIAAPDGLEASGALPGDAVVHLDLHPLNVLLGPEGPVVIDWANTRRGPAGADIATTWLLIACADAPGHPIKRVVLGAARRAFLRVFLDEAGRAAARPWMHAVAAERAGDTHLGASEKARMRTVAEHASVAPGRRRTRSSARSVG